MTLFKVLFGLARHIAHVEETKSEYRFLVRKLEMNRPLRIFGHKFEDNFEIN